MLARAVALLIGLALVAAILFASLRDDDVPTAQSPAEAIEAARSPAPPTVLAMPDAADREVAGTPTLDSEATHAVDVVTKAVSVAPEHYASGVRVVVGVGPLPPRDASDVDSRRPAFVHDGVTDANGRMSVAIPWSEIELARERTDAVLWGRVEHPGFQERLSIASLPKPTSARSELSVLTFPGRTVRGRVVNEKVEPVAAMVTCHRPDSTGKLGFGIAARTDSDGWFEIGAVGGGVQHLIADADDLGTGAARDIDVDGLHTEPIVIVVCGPGLVRGRVLDGEGRSYGDLELGVWLAALDDDVGSFVFPEPAHSEARLQGGGRIWGRVRTDKWGTFEVHGLRNDRYVVRAAGSASGPFSALLTPEPVASDGEQLELRLERTYIAVRVVDLSGELCATPIGTGTDTGDNGYVSVPPMPRWPKDLRVIVMPRAADTNSERWSNPRLAGRVNEKGEFVYLADAGRSYRVGLMGGTQPWSPVEVEIPAHGGRVEVVLRPSDADALGTLSLLVRGRAGRVFPAQYSITIEDVTDGTPLMFDDADRDSLAEREIVLPEGAYRLVVAGQALVEDYHGEALELGSNGRFESLLTITRDTTTRVEVDLPVGARIELDLRGEVLQEDVDAVRADHAPGTIFGGPLDYWSGRTTTSLVAPNRWPIPVLFNDDWAGSGPGFMHVLPWILVGKTGTSEPLPAGKYRFEARMPGGRVVARDVTLVDGETLKLVIAMPSVPASPVDGK